jgi:hypothetical protein
MWPFGELASAKHWGWPGNTPPLWLKSADDFAHRGVEILPRRKDV